MKIKAVMKMVSLPRSGILRRVREGIFPAYELKDGYMFWRHKDIQNWKKNEKARKTFRKN